MTSTGVEALLPGIDVMTIVTDAADSLDPKGKKKHSNKKHRSDLLSVSKDTQRTEVNTPVKQRSSGSWLDRADCGQ